MKKLFCLFLSVLCILGCTACGGEETPPTADKTHMYGFFEPLWEKRANSNEDQVIGFNRDVTVYLMGAMGCNSFRMMFPASIFSKFIVDYDDGTIEIELDEEMVPYFHESIQKLHDAGIGFIVGEGIVLPPFVTDAGQSVPAGSLGVPVYGVDSCYETWAEAVSQAWTVLVGEFDEITYWEMGNEYNADTFFHPATYNPDTKQGGFAIDESAAANTDYMYFANRGILAANSEAVTLTPGWTSLGNMASREIEYFLGYVYDNINSGEFPRIGEKSTDSDDYFGGFSWHPYDGMPMDEDWIGYNDDIYQLAIDNGDDGKPVIFTEMGWFDSNSPDLIASQSEAAKLVYRYCMEEMRYVESCLWFRLYNCEYDWAGLGANSPEKTYGVFYEPTKTQGFMPKQKAVVMQEIFGGTGDLEMWSDLEKLNEKLAEDR